MPKYIFRKIVDRTDPQGRELPKGIIYNSYNQKYVIRFTHNGKDYDFTKRKNFDEILTEYEKIKKMINEKGFEYAYEHRKDFQKNFYHNDDMKFITFDKSRNYYQFHIEKEKTRFHYSNADLDKVKEVRDYYLKNGEEATIKKYNLYRNENKDLGNTQLAMNYYENKTLNRNNTSGYNGISWLSNEKKWRSSIGINNKLYNLGTFSNKEDAVKARELANENGIEWYKKHKLEYFKPKEVEFEEDTTTWDSLDDTFDRKLNTEIKGNIYITGMQGSGKTTLAHDLKKEYGYKITHLDDFMDKYNEDEVDEIIEEFVEKSNDTTGNIIEGVQLLDLLDLIDIDKHTIILIDNDPKIMQEQMWERDKIKPETFVNGVEVFTPGEHYEQYMKMYNSKKPILEELRKDKRIVKIKNVESL